MSAKSLPPANVTLELRASPALILLFSAVHGGALGLASFFPIDFPYRVALMVAIAGSCYRTLQKYGWRRSAGAVVAFEWKTEAPGTRCAVRFRLADTWLDGDIAESWLHARLVVLAIRCHGRRWPVSVLIPADAVEVESFRRLRVGLSLRSAAE